jgi:hypothetical protein
LLPAEAKETANTEIKELYEGFGTQFGMRGVPNVVKALTNNPGLATRSRTGRGILEGRKPVFTHGVESESLVISIF